MTLAALTLLSLPLLAFLMLRIPPVAVSERPAPTSAHFTVNGEPLTVHALPTGTVTIKHCHHNGCGIEKRGYLTRFLAILLDPRFADPMPIWTYAIEHPDGLFLIDAGATPAYNDPETWAADPISRRMVQSFIRLDVTASETVSSRLHAIGLAPEQVLAVVLTHQHIDHTASVPDLPNADVWTNAIEDASAEQIGALSWRWRDDNTAIRHVDREGSPSATGLGASVALTSDGTLEAIHTPGHTPGSLSARLQTDQGEIWFTGDTSFTAEHMDPSAPTAGIHTDMEAVRALQAELGRRTDALLLPSHDWTAPKRLTNFQENTP